MQRVPHINLALAMVLFVLGTLHPSACGEHSDGQERGFETAELVEFLGSIFESMQDAETQVRSPSAPSTAPLQPPDTTRAEPAEDDLAEPESHGHEMPTQQEIDEYLDRVLRSIVFGGNADKVFRPNPAAFQHAVRPDGKPLIIAHRGASGVLPEHTMAAYAAAYYMDADVIEPDVVLTKDGVLICSHDLTLDSTTDVSEKFPGRARDDGKHYAIDFTLVEIKTLEKLGREGRIRQHGHSVVTLDEMIGLVQSLNASTGRNVGIIPEPKSPLFHSREGQPIERPLLEVLTRHGYTDRDHACVIQCFDFDSLIIFRNELGTDLSLCYLFSDAEKAQPLEDVALICDSIGPKKDLIIAPPSGPTLENSNNAILADAEANGLAVYTWTFGNEPVYMAKAVQAGLAGYFTDYTDSGVVGRDLGVRIRTAVTENDVDTKYRHILDEATNIVTFHRVQIENTREKGGPYIVLERWPEDSPYQLTTLVTLSRVPAGYQSGDVVSVRGRMQMWKPTSEIPNTHGVQRVEYSTVHLHLVYPVLVQ